MNINTNLEDVLNLAPIEDDEQDETKLVPVEIGSDLTTPEVLDRVDKIASALPEVKGLEASDQELDDLADMATRAYKDILELGFNTDPRHGAEVLQVASNMLAHAITAKTNKIQKKLKMIDLQIKKQRVDQYEREQNKEPAGAIPSKATEIDRNTLVEQLMKKKST